MILINESWSTVVSYDQECFNSQHDCCPFFCCGNPSQYSPLPLLDLHLRLWKSRFWLLGVEGHYKCLLKCSERQLVQTDNVGAWKWNTGIGELCRLYTKNSFPVSMETFGLHPEYKLLRHMVERWINRIIWNHSLRCLCWTTKERCEKTAILNRI